MLAEYGSGADHDELVTVIEDGATGDPQRATRFWLTAASCLLLKDDAMLARPLQGRHCRQ